MPRHTAPRLGGDSAARISLAPLARMRTDEDRVVQIRAPVATHDLQSEPEGDSAPPGESRAQLQAHLRGRRQAQDALLCLVPVSIVVVLLFCILGLANCQPDPVCFNDCSDYYDGSCDDGGSGHDYSLCEYGHDCWDCGTRFRTCTTIEPDSLLVAVVVCAPWLFFIFVIILGPAEPQQAQAQVQARTAEGGESTIGMPNEEVPDSLPADPIDSTRSDGKLGRVLAGTISEGHVAECPICMEGLCLRPCAVFVRGARRTCPHYIHEDCAEMLENARSTVDRESGRGLMCPVCRTDSAATRLMPRIEDNPRAWFAAADVAGDGRLSRREVELALVSQFPLNYAELSASLDECWRRWDHAGSGYISTEEFVAPGTGLLDYARKYLLRETPAPAVAVAMIY